MSDEAEKFDEPEISSWEKAATSAVEHALESADFDELQGVVIVPDYSAGDPPIPHYCHSIEELQETLEAIYNAQWYPNVVIEGGDASAYVSELVEPEEIQQFFAQFGSEPEGDRIIAAPELLAASASQVLRVDLEDINDELIVYLAKHPEKMRELQPRKFEELVAELFRSKGYDVQLTQRTRDGGLDIYAVQRSAIGAAMVIIECKRYAAKNKVGVEIIRGLYGVVEHKSATKGIIATTSYFTKAAKEFHNDLQYRLGLADFDAICTMLNECRKKKS